MSRVDSGRFAPFIPTLDLSAHEVELLMRQAQALVSAAVDEYQHYRDGAADWATWKEVRRCDTIRVFRERQSITKNAVDRNGAAMLPEVLAIGNVAGTVEDMVFGAMATTGTDMLINSKSCAEGLVGAKVMHTLLAPTQEHPFRQVSAKWFSFSLGSGVCSLRDCSMIESTGITLLENREKLGYVLRHSVHFDGVPNLQPFGVVRAKIATWAIYRESAQGMVQCFVKSFHDLGSGTWRRMGLKSVCDRALAMCTYAQCAEMKKLARQHRIYHSKCDRLRMMGAALDSSKRTARSAVVNDSECAVCLSPFTTTLLGSSTKQCQICQLAVCPLCLEKKSVCLAEEDSQRVTVQPLRVCAPCVKSAITMSSMRVQCDQLLEDDEAARVRDDDNVKPPHWNMSLTDSESSDFHI